MHKYVLIQGFKGAREKKEKTGNSREYHTIILAFVNSIHFLLYCIGKFIYIIMVNNELILHMFTK